jgi:hypothetical protein
MGERVRLPDVVCGSVPEVEAASGDRRSVLVAMRALLAERLEGAADTAVAPIAAQLRLVLAELDSLGAEEPGGALDELVARREARRGAAG